MELEKLVEEFARHVEAGTDAVWQGDSKVGSTHANWYIAAFKKLRAHGDAGRDALRVLLEHPRMDVWVTAAACLLRHRTAEAKAVLEDAAKGEGMVPLEARQALQLWAEGTWALDPA
jgi:hypothetical protein